MAIKSKKSKTKKLLKRTTKKPTKVDDSYFLSISDAPLLAALFPLLVAFLFVYAEHVTAISSGFTWTLLFAVIQIPLFFISFATAITVFVLWERKGKNTRVRTNIFLSVLVFSLIVIFTVPVQVREYYKNRAITESEISSQAARKSLAKSDKENRIIDYSKTKIYAYKSSFVPEGFKADVLRTNVNSPSLTNIYYRIYSIDTPEKTRSLLSVSSYANSNYIGEVIQSQGKVIGTTKFNQPLLLYTERQTDYYFTTVNDSFILISSGDVPQTGFTSGDRLLTRNIIFDLVNGLEREN